MYAYYILLLWASNSIIASIITKTETCRFSMWVVLARSQDHQKANSRQYWKRNCAFQQSTSNLTSHQDERKRKVNGKQYLPVCIGIPKQEDPHRQLLHTRLWHHLDDLTNGEVGELTSHGPPTWTWRKFYQGAMEKQRFLNFKPLLATFASLCSLVIEVFFKRNERGFPLIVRWAVRRETRTNCSISLFVPICAATFCFVFWCGFFLQSKETSLFLEWKSRIWCKLGREEGWVYLERRPRTGFLSCVSASCILSLVLVVRKSLALPNFSMSSLKAFPAERKEGRKRQKNQKPKPLRITKNQKNLPNNKRKHPSTKTTSHVTRNLSSKINPETPKFSNGYFQRE